MPKYVSLCLVKNSEPKSHNSYSKNDEVLGEIKVKNEGQAL